MSVKAWMLVMGVAFNIVAARAVDEKFAVLKIGSESFTNVTIFSVNANSIIFSHNGGMGNAKLKDLSPELQKMFHYDPAKAAASEQAQAESHAAYVREVQTAKPPPPAASAPAILAGHGLQADEVPPHQLYAKAFLNEPAPGIIVEKWLTAEPDMRGKFVLIDFWATWCNPCREAIPELNDFHQKFQDKLVVMGLSDESEEAVRRMTNPHIDYAVAIDTQRRSKREVGVTGIPHALLIDPKGIVRFEGMPYYLSERSLAKLLARYGE